MGSDERRPSLEAPSLGFRRRRKSPPAPSGEPVAAEPAADDRPAETDGPADPRAGVPTPVVTAERPVAPAAQVEPAGPAGRAEAQPPRATRGPLNGHLAAALAGLAVAAFLVLGTFGGGRMCESARGTSSCGGGPGFLMLVLIVAVAVVIGAAVLRWAGVPSAGSISFLAVALVAVISLLFLVDDLDRAAGAVAVAVLTPASYLLAHVVSVRYVDAVE